MVAILNLHFELEPMKYHRGSSNFRNQHTLKPLRANFGASIRECTTQPKIVTYNTHQTTHCRSESFDSTVLEIV